MGQNRLRDRTDCGTEPAAGQDRLRDRTGPGLDTARLLKLLSDVHQLSLDFKENHSDGGTAVMMMLNHKTSIFKMVGGWRLVVVV